MAVKERIRVVRNKDGGAGGLAPVKEENPVMRRLHPPDNGQYF